ncbi:MAG: 30S ribosomal protein S1 [Candidatus Omnitrophica bacterium]|nr:30S ribosomal protein S1 [Candidatus Omnitrophota bacterium]MDD5487568.1 30S ribosomal protein S1 [Candidatus Omnitrophota bacterium]
MKIEREEANGEVLAMDQELAALYEQSISDIREGEILKGTIVHIGEKEVLVDVGYKSEGIVMKSEISDPEELKVGGPIDVMLESKENELGMVVLSHEKAKRLKTWDNIVQNKKEGDIVTGKVSRKVRGGFMVDIGMGAFLPASLSMMQEFGGPDNILGKKLEFKIVKINIPRKNIVLSRKELVEEKRRDEKIAILEGLNKGDVVKGIVRNITDFGAFIDIGGGITGLLHITDMSWGRINHPSDVVSIGSDIEVKVLDFDKESVKVSLGLKQRTPNPWESITDKYPEGSVINGRVVNIMPYGVFVELEKGIEGLIHISEFSWSKKFNHPSEKFQVGDQVQAMILSVDKDNQKLSLGIKQLEKDPWEGVEGRYNAGDKVKGTISAVTDYGAFVEMEKGVEGLVHVSDLSWTKRITHPKEKMKKGDEIEAIILNVDEQNRRIALGVKQLTEDPWDQIVKKYKPDTVCDGRITNITNFGIFVELEDELEGLLHVSEIDLGPNQRMESIYKVGDPVNVKVIHIDGVQKKIALSSKGLEQQAAPVQETAQATAEPVSEKAEEAVPAEEVSPETTEEAAPQAEEKTEQ